MAKRFAARLCLQGREQGDTMAHESTQQFPNDTGQESGKHIVLALVIAAVIVFGARLFADHFIRPPAPPAVAALAVPAAAASANSATEDELAAEARKARQIREQAIIDQDRARREQKKADVMRARDEAAAAAQAEDARREAAWQRFFTRSRKCDTATDDATRVDCSNQYIRAKERFDKLYAEGKLR